MKLFSEEYLSEFVYGGIDGIVTTFAIVAASAAAGLSSGTILVLGFANVLADGISMGVSDYLSNRSEHDQYHKQRRKVVRLLEKSVNQAQKIIAKHLKRYGLKDDSLKKATETIQENPNAADFIMKEEHNMVADMSNPFFNALVTFFSFILVGSVPMMAYLVDFVNKGPNQNLFLQTSILAAIAFSGIGWLKSRVAHAPLIKSITETLVLGALAAGAAYGVGAWLEPLFLG